jgi:hypothetical protein
VDSESIQLSAVTETRNHTGTKAFQATPLEINNRRIILADTPGLGSSNGSDTKALAKFLEMLPAHYKNHETALQGIIYLHSLTGPLAPQLREQVLGAEHLSTLGSMANLGMALRSQGKHAEAEQLHRQALQLTEQVLGAEHPSTLGSMVDLGISSMKALDHFKQLCTGNNRTNIVLATTRWESIPASKGVAREKELREGIWKDMMAEGVVMGRYVGSEESAIEIVRLLFNCDELEELKGLPIAPGNRSLSPIRQYTRHSLPDGA